MRPIKFRAWDKRKEVMPYFTGQPRIETNSPVTNLVFTLENWTAKFKYDDSHYTQELDQNVGENLILMQFTGLLDKNSKEIYEGDIIQIEQDEGIEEYPNWVKHQAEVTYSNGCFFGIFGLPLYELIQEPHNYELEVIGNKWESSHLNAEQPQ